MCHFGSKIDSWHQMESGLSNSLQLWNFSTLVNRFSFWGCTPNITIMILWKYGKSYGLVCNVAPWAFIFSFYFNERCLCGCVSIVFTVGCVVWSLWNIRNLTLIYGCFFRVPHKHTYVNMVVNMFKLIALAWASEISNTNIFTYMVWLWILAFWEFLQYFCSFALLCARIWRWQ